MWLWSWVLTANGALYMLIAGKWPRIGWPIGFFSQGLWVAYAFQVNQSGFLASAALFAVVYGRNWYVAIKNGPESKKRMVGSVCVSIKAGTVSVMRDRRSRSYGSHQWRITNFETAVA